MQLHSSLSQILYQSDRNQHWAFYQIRKIVGCACAENAGNVFPATDFKENL